MSSTKRLLFKKEVDPQENVSGHKIAIIALVNIAKAESGKTAQFPQRGDFFPNRIIHISGIRTSTMMQPYWFQSKLHAAQFPILQCSIQLILAMCRN